MGLRPTEQNIRHYPYIPIQRCAYLHGEFRLFSTRSCLWPEQPVYASELIYSQESIYAKTINNYFETAVSILNLTLRGGLGTKSSLGGRAGAEAIHTVIGLPYGYRVC